MFRIDRFQLQLYALAGVSTVENGRDVDVLHGEYGRFGPGIANPWTPIADLRERIASIVQQF
ncbi:hypothetical protein [Mycobacterium leprae]|uniref:Uncharacterized protein n=1 Tax=Mycobacterium leprae TaxID=1769 RepID=O33027_MYCLR|nr:hypothetical protein [Mycobacterium leprae]CAB10646.1 hypothetical protein MLCB250.52c [Mycobacterium leprae]